MADLYSSVEVSPLKKRCPPELDDVDFTPKRMRTATLLKSATAAKSTPKAVDLPSHLTRLQTIHNGIQHALSHALASCAVSPSSDTGIVRNVLNHISLQTYTGLTAKFTVDDLRRLCWIWEWDGKAGEAPATEEDDNPFMETLDPVQSKEWSRGAMGFVVTAATHHSKTDKKRVPAYGIGIEVEMNIDKDMGGGMAAVARWTAASEQRKAEFRAKLVKWQELNEGTSSIPLAKLPELSTPPKASALTRVFVSMSPKGVASLPIPVLPGSPCRSPTKRSVRDFAVPFPITPCSSGQKSPTKNSVLFPQTPSRRDRVPPSTQTPNRGLTSSNTSTFDIPSGLPSTPVHQRGSAAVTVPQTPTSSRRQALYERVRHRSLTASPTKTPKHDIVGAKLSRDQMLKLGQDEMRRRCLLGRLPDVAESVWMMFTGPASGSATATPTHRKRRALPTTQVANAVIKSSPIPISMSEAVESLEMLTEMCPFFLKSLSVTGEEWLEMPMSNTVEVGAVPPSPGPKSIKDSATELLTRSPKRVKREGRGGLREVREIIRKELELQN